MEKRDSLMKRKMVAFWLVLSLLLFTVYAGAEETIIVNPESAPGTAEETAAMVDAVLKETMESTEIQSFFADEVTVVTETVPSDWYADEPQTVYTLRHGGEKLRFMKETVGEADESGRYPLYITLHGGGGGPEEMNNDQWIDMFHYYRNSVENGIYVAVRGVSDTWDLHFREETYPLLDELITYMSVMEHADQNRVYLLGFSAGGDGVYQLAPRLADRFAAVNMSSGHPNGVSLLNTANCPICLQAGIRDYYTEDAKRSVRCAEFEKTLEDYRDKYGFGYEHQVWIHVPEGHNYIDYADSHGLVLAPMTSSTCHIGSTGMTKRLTRLSPAWLAMNSAWNWRRRIRTRFAGFHSMYGILFLRSWSGTWEPARPAGKSLPGTGWRRNLR